MIQTTEENTMQKRSDEIRDKYIANPPEGMTADDIRHMSEDDLLDMDYFLNEDDEFGEDFDLQIIVKFNVQFLKFNA